MKDPIKEVERIIDEEIIKFSVKMEKVANNAFRKIAQPYFVENNVTMINGGAWGLILKADGKTIEQFDLPQEIQDLFNLRVLGGFVLSEYFDDFQGGQFLNIK